MAPDQKASDSAAERRQSREAGRRLLLALHFKIWLGVTILVAILNFTIPWQVPWFLLPLVGWGAPLAIHTAFVMGLFGRPRD